jgi:asparagine synthase (glutamine-hydrolysing)
MAAALRHRGPDAFGFYVADGGDVSLVHTRLSIIDLHERANQPLHYEHARRTFVLVFNGEIYNYRELRRELERLGCAFRTETDSEVILAAYAVWGGACVRRFNGMWAFAIVDAHDGRLFLSRDRFGKKPLYYHESSRFLFASEIKAILEYPLPRIADTASVSDFLNFGLSGHTDATFFRGIKQLPAGCNGSLDLRTHHFQIERYYTLPTDTAVVTPSDVHDALRTAVERRLISDVPICLSLSGGVDSSGVAAMIAESHNDQMVAFTTTSVEGVGDETANVATLLALYPQFELIAVPLTSADLQDDLRRMIHHLEEPFVYDSPFVRWKIAEAIHSQEFKVSITGEGADELLGGYPVASHLFLADLWRRRHFGRVAFELLFTLLQPDARAILSQFRGWLRRDRDARARDYFLQIARQFGCRLPPSKDGASLVAGDVTLKERLHSQVTRFFLPFLLTCNDKMYMAHSVEARAPFLDVELAELLSRIATELLIVRGIRKYPLRRALRGRVPESVLFDRRKIGFASPLGARLSSAAAREWIRPLLAEPRIESFVEPEKLRREYENLTPEAEVKGFLLQAITLELWMRRFDVASA